MKTLSLKTGLLAAALLGAAVFSGCERLQQPAGGPPAPPPAEVQVSEPVVRTVRDYEEFPGRVEAVDTISVRAHLTGYLDKVNLREGQEVKAGELLFEIDPRPFKAELDRAAATLVQAEAHRDRLDADYRRAAKLLDSRAISREEYDKVVGDRAEAEAAIGVARAIKELAEVNLGYTKVQAKINGRASRRFVDPGNLIKADDTILTTLVSLDPIYATFDIDERTTLRLQRLMRDGTMKWSTDVGLPVELGLADEPGYPHQGTVNFTDNVVDTETGTWRLRAILANKDRVLSPGMFVRVHLPLGKEYQATLVSEQALGTDQGQKFLYVVSDAGKVQNRRVKVGRQHEGLRVILDGLGPNEKVIVSGLQRVRDGVMVNPAVVPMPMADNKANGAEPEKKLETKQEKPTQ